MDNVVIYDPVTGAIDPTKVWTRVNATTVASPGTAVQIGRWLTLQQYEPRMLEHVDAVYRAMDFTASWPSHTLGIAYCNWAAQQGWLRS